MSQGLRQASGWKRQYETLKWNDAQEDEPGMKFGGSTRPKCLKPVGRELLGSLFGPFGADLAAKSVAMPAAESEDDAYFKELSGLAMAQAGLPDILIETLFAR